MTEFDQYCDALRAYRRVRDAYKKDKSLADEYVKAKRRLEAAKKRMDNAVV